MPFRDTLREHKIPDEAPTQEAWILSPSIAWRLPEGFKNTIDSIANSGNEFNISVKSYQNDEYVFPGTIAELEATYKLLNQNIQILGEAVGNLNDKQQEAAGGEEGMKEVKKAVEGLERALKPYRIALEDVIRTGQPRYKGEGPGTRARRRSDSC